MTAEGVAAPLMLATSHGSPPVTGRIRVEPEDFYVEELLGFEPDGSGGHVLLLVEKRGANTGWVGTQLARAAGVPAREVGWSGQKDRHALTRQSYSLPWPTTRGLDALSGLAGEGFRVVSAARHGRKLRPGSHRGNRFVIRVREARTDPAELEARVLLLSASGVPNYFGPQRFGRVADNLGRARRWATGGEPPRERLERGFALSAARAALFNAVLARRVARGSWNRLLEGEAVMLDGRRSYFRAGTIDEELRARCATMDVHPSGPLWGRGESPATGEARTIEADVVAGEPALAGLLEAQGLEHERRSLRLPVRGLRALLEGDMLTMEFELPRGAFATAVLHEVLRDAWDAKAGGED